MALSCLKRLFSIIDRKINNPKTAAQRAYAYLAILQITPFNPSFLSALNFDLWPDYEDGLQYCCALSGNCDIILTTNSPDFFASELPVIDPLNFVLQHQ
ncbi:PIN domain-containing protein [Cyclobacterium jeungdonense]|uniref:PIN domain-containing protein n=1 Tax=Cyclobacterium jeungdonense TaxID=708087 RepID=A0ABT8CBE4_9BACT|nr:PIN domain-containing protein [Cyclobacterium jeungdonense]MDN3689118.1 PIN domain-containing protein [Cyclobacterium jeungdonense]